MTRKKRSCPTGKVRFRDRQSAIAALHKIRNDDQREVTPTRVYDCPACRGVHLTSTWRAEW